ncbi:MFS transporter [Streptomyces sp. SCUT-3]|uniref:CynX/NimT family MFS transporter n=1 Tax=Streptomyces TaxID=1883 RepID=UPI0015F9540B|nr:MFS transporter [Streptomyces sp. SCUT-3]QMV24020.1 MFS transporter [Streptomyces sp. SCUT-3]
MRDDQVPTPTAEPTGAGPVDADPAEADPATRDPRARRPGRRIPASRAAAGGALATAGLLLASLNLRPAITSLGSLLEEVRVGLGLSGTVAGLLTSLPALCFAAFGLAAPRMARRWGPAVVVASGTALITAGLVLRPLADSTAPFLLASAVTLAGIALSNIMMPVVVKRYFPERVGSMTGLYSMGLSAGTALAAGLTVPVAEAFGGNWRAGLWVWAVPALAAALLWPAIARADRAGRIGRTGGEGRPGAGTGRDGGTARDGGTDAAPAAAPLRITRSRTAWGLAAFMGLQSTAAYVTMGWLPQIFRDAGTSAATAGLLLACVMTVSVPMAFVLPALAARSSSQGRFAVVLGLCGLSGYAGLWTAPAAAPWLWALLLGLSNSAFPLALTMIGMRARSSAGVVRLSAFAQSTGYLISFPGPILIGALYQRTGGWDLPIALMAALMVPQIGAGLLAGRNRHVEDEALPRGGA